MAYWLAGGYSQLAGQLWPSAAGLLWLQWLAGGWLASSTAFMHLIWRYSLCLTDHCVIFIRIIIGIIIIY